MLNVWKVSNKNISEKQKGTNYHFTAEAIAMALSTFRLVPLVF